MVESIIQVENLSKAFGGEPLQRFFDTQDRQRMSERDMKLAGLEMDLDEENTDYLRPKNEYLYYCTYYQILLMNTYEQKLRQTNVPLIKYQ